MAKYPGNALFRPPSDKILLNGYDVLNCPERGVVDFDATRPRT